MKKLIFIILFIMILVVPSAVSAQEQLSIDSLQIEFWPEYDRPDMLVLYNIQLSEDTVLPVSLSFRIPASAGEPNAVAIASDDRWINADYSTEALGDWTLVNIVADSNLVHLEYYDPNLQIDGFSRNFEFTWLGDYAVNFLQYKIQEPLNSSNLSISVPASVAIPESGLNYYFSEFNDVKLGETFSVTISYNKSSNDLSFSPSETSTTDNPSPLSLQLNPRYLLGIFAVALIAYGIYNNFKPTKTITRGTRKKVSRGLKPSRRKTEPENVFCHNCGTSGSKKDKFCRECGEKRRN